MRDDDVLIQADRPADGDLEAWGEPRSKQVSWHDPVATAAHGAALSGREYLEAIRDGQLPPPPIANLVAMRLATIGDGEAVFRCEPDESVYNPIGMVHGGLLCTLLDSAAGCAVHTQLPAGVGYSTIEIKVSFLRPVHAGAGELEVRGRVVRAGRRVVFAEAEARDTSGRLVGQATTSVLVVGAA
jgi:uncharacterized protein (TIGR00369 family)